MKKQTKGILLVLSTAIISGVSIFINSLFVEKVAPSSFTFLKNSIVGIAILLLIVSASMLLKKPTELKTLKPKEWGKLVLIGLIGGSIPFLLFFEGLAITDPAAGSFIHKTMFILVALMATVFLKEKLHRHIQTLAVMIFLGNYFILEPEIANGDTGVLLIFLATLFWASENIISKSVLKTLSGNTVAFGRMFFGSIFLLIYIAATGQFSYIQTLNTDQWILVVVASALLLGYVLTWYNGLKHIPVSMATAILLLGSPITLILSALIKGKVLNISQNFGILLIVLGITVWIVTTTKNLKKSSCDEIPQYSHSEQ